jgi:hypothetical protein
MSPSDLGDRVFTDQRLRDACAKICAVVVAIPRADRMDVTAVALRALVDGGYLESDPRST